MGVKTNVRFMTNLVNAASKSRRWVMAAQLLQLMRSYGVTPNDVTFTSILSEMSKAKQVGDERLDPFLFFRGLSLLLRCCDLLGGW